MSETFPFPYREELPLPKASEIVDDVVFDVRDRDGNHRLTPHEFEQGRDVTERLNDPDQFARFDANGDRQIDAQEWRKGRDTDRLDGRARKPDA